jgi:hypothetical protein
MSRDGAMKPDSPAAKYQPKPEEFAAVESITARRNARPPAPKLKIIGKGADAKVGFDHPDNSTAWLLLVNALGATDYDFVDGLVSQVVNAGTQGKNVDGKGPNFMLSVIKGIAPNDEVECMMAA